MEAEFTSWLEQSAERLITELLDQVRQVSAGLTGVVSIRADLRALLQAVTVASRSLDDPDLLATVNRIGRHWLSLGIPIEEIVRALLRFDNVLVPAVWEAYDSQPAKLRCFLQESLLGLNRLVFLFTQLHTKRQERILAGQIAAIEQQQEELRRMTVPVLEVWDDVVMLPIVGSLDTRRGRLLMEGLLHTISSKRSRYVILDVTGVTEIDSTVAGLLIQTVQAARLVGARTLLVGVTPMIAQTLVDLQVDLPDTETVSSVRAGLERVIRRLGYTITRTDSAPSCAPAASARQMPAAPCPEA